MKSLIIFILISSQSFAAVDPFKKLKCSMNMMMPDYYTADIEQGRANNTYNVGITYYYYGYKSTTPYVVKKTETGFEGRGIRIFDISSHQPGGSIDLKIQTKNEGLLEMNCPR